MHSSRGVEPEPLERGGHQVGHGIIAGAADSNKSLAGARYSSWVHSYLTTTTLGLSEYNTRTIEKNGVTQQDWVWFRAETLQNNWKHV